jgi:hypothetical protein
VTGVERHSVIRSGAVDSSSYQWLSAWHSTRCHGSVRLATARVLAAVPVATKNAAVSPPNSAWMAAVARAVNASSP